LATRVLADKEFCFPPHWFSFPLTCWITLAFLSYWKTSKPTWKPRYLMACPLPSHFNLESSPQDQF
jgi:hypothetical protein